MNYRRFQSDPKLRKANVGSLRDEVPYAKTDDVLTYRRIFEIKRIHCVINTPSHKIRIPRVPIIDSTFRLDSTSK